MPERFARVILSASIVTLVALVVLALTPPAHGQTGPATTTPPKPAQSPGSLPSASSQVTTPANEAPGATNKPAAPTQRDIPLGKLAIVPKIDGVLNEGEWTGAAKAELNYQVEPGDNISPTEKTEVMLAADREHLYLAFRCFDSSPSTVRAPVSRRDHIYNDDYVAIYLDTFDDRLRAYALYFNPLGIQADGVIGGGASLNSASEIDDVTWDGIYESKGALTKDGYVVEAAIPFKTLRFRAGKEKRWGLHIQRRVARKAERIHWQPISRDRADLLPQMGTISGLDGIYTGRTLDLIPTVTASINGEREASVLSSGGARLNSVNRVDPGLTATYTITPNLTFSAAVNPDFSQIEADVPQINVNQRFPLFFPERRPFFLEGAEVFDSPGALTFVNTRSIIDPDWGVKLTGKVGRNTVGLLSASDRAPGLLLPPTNKDFGRNARFNIFRYSRDILENSRVGLYVTDRRFAGTSSTLYAADGQLRFRKVNTVGYQLGYSRTRGVDGQTRGGAVSYVWYEHRGRSLRIFLNDWKITRDYREAAGFVRRTGFHSNAANIGYELRPKEKSWWVSVRPFIVPKLLRTDAGLIDESYVDPGAAITLARDISFYIYRSWHKDSFQGREYPYKFVYAYYNINSFKRFSFTGYIQPGEAVNFDPRNPQVGRSWNSQTTVTFRPNPRLNVQLSHFKSNLQDKRTGARLFNQDIIRNRTTYQFTRFSALRAIIDYDTSKRQTGVSLLYAYTPRPNTALYIGYNDLLFNGIDPLDNTRAQGIFRQRRTLFMKLSYNFRF